MSPSPLKCAVRAAAVAHVAKLFDVLCCELASAGDDATAADAAGERFHHGVKLVNRAVQIALAGEQE